jgi:hypothetical protein
MSWRVPGHRSGQKDALEGALRNGHKSYPSQDVAQENAEDIDLITGRLPKNGKFA